DYCVGLSFSLFLYFVVHRNGLSANGWYAYVARHLSNMSYTLYLAHFPLLLFLYATIQREGRWQPDTSHLCLLTGLCTLVFFYAYLLSRVTEARTERIRRFFTGRKAESSRTGPAHHKFDLATSDA